MKAIVYDNYGSLDGLSLRELPQPAIGEKQALVRVKAAAVHVGDLIAIKGSPVVVRLDTGLRKPKYGVPGYDVAGVVEAVGSAVTDLKPGDEVFGSARGTCAEFAAADAAKLAPKPANLSFEEAAALPTSGLAALHGLRETGKLQAGQKLLINGAAGGVGSFAVQIGKALGAEVTGVCSAASAEMVRSLGADHLIDYAREDFTRGEQRYDLIFDNVENHDLADVRRALTPTGTLVLNSGTGSEGFAMFVRMVKPLLISPFARQKLRRYLSIPKRADLLTLKELAEAGKLRPVIDGVYPLAEARAAFDRIAGHHVHGKLVITP